MIQVTVTLDETSDACGYVVPWRDAVFGVVHFAGAQVHSDGPEPLRRLAAAATRAADELAKKSSSAPDADDIPF